MNKVLWIEDEERRSSSDKRNLARNLELEFVKRCMENMNTIRENKKLEKQRNLQERKKILLERKRSLEEQERRLEERVRERRLEEERERRLQEIKLLEIEKKFRERTIEIEKKFQERKVEIDLEVKRKFSEKRELKSNQMSQDKNEVSPYKESVKKWEEQVFDTKYERLRWRKSRISQNIKNNRSVKKQGGRKLSEVITNLWSKHGEDLTKMSSRKLTFKHSFEDSIVNLFEVTVKKVSLDDKINKSLVQNEKIEEVYQPKYETSHDEEVSNPQIECDIYKTELLLDKENSADNQMVVNFEIVSMMVKEDMIRTENHLMVNIHVKEIKVKNCGTSEFTVKKIDGKFNFLENKNGSTDVKELLQEILKFKYFTKTIKWKGRIDYLMIDRQFCEVFDPGIQLKEVTMNVPLRSSGFK